MELTSVRGSRRFLELRKDDPDVEGGDASMTSPNESYALVVDPETESIVIKAQHASGAFYGVQSLRSLLLRRAVDDENDDDDDVEGVGAPLGSIPGIEIKDAPRSVPWTCLQ